MAKKTAKKTTRTAKTTSKATKPIKATKASGKASKATKRALATKALGPNLATCREGGLKGVNHYRVLKVLALKGELCYREIEDATKAVFRMPKGIYSIISTIVRAPYKDSLGTLGLVTEAKYEKESGAGTPLYFKITKKGLAVINKIDNLMAKQK